MGVSKYKKQDNSIEQIMLYLKYSYLLFIFVSNLQFTQNSLNVIWFVRCMYGLFCRLPCLVAYTFNIAWVGRYRSVTPVEQLRRQLSVRFYSNWCYTWSRFCLLAKKNRLASNWHSKLLNIIKSVP